MPASDIPPPRATAADVLFAAVSGLVAVGWEEFSEFDISVAAWGMDPKRFGLRGYETKHPDHKRIYVNLIHKLTGIAGRHLGLLRKVRPNVYCLTAAGWARYHQEQRKVDSA